MNFQRVATLAISTTALALATGAGAQAAPTSRGFSVVAPCNDGQTLDVIVPPGHGEWTSGVVLEGGGTFKVYAFSYSDTAADGSVDGPYLDQQAGGAVADHNPQPVVTCTQTAPDGNGGTITLAITGFFTR